MIGEVEVVVAVRQWSLMLEVAVEAVMLLTTTAADDTQEDKTA